MWQHLLETALLGTEKKALDAAHLPEEIRNFLHDRHAHDPELKYLETVSLVHFYREAGKMPARYMGTWDEQIIDESKPIAAPVLLEIFSKLDSVDYQVKENLFNRWLNVLIDHGYIISPELVTRVLKTGDNFSQQTRAKIVEVIGNKGAWVLSHSNDLKYKPPVAQDHLWQEGTHTERKNYFLAMRGSTIAQSIIMLRATWQEESVVNKKSFLEIIRETSATEDLSFVETLYETEFKFHAKEKKTEKECRRILSSILLNHPQTTLYNDTAAKIAAYFTKGKKGLVGFVTGKDAVVFTVPEEDDSFWNADTMAQTYGLETKNIDIARYNYAGQFWLSWFIETMPMVFWSQPFAQDYKQLLDHFLDNEKHQVKTGGEVISIYQEAFIDNAKHHKDAALAKALVQRLNPQKAMSLLSIMRVEDYEAYVHKNKYVGDVEILLNGPFDHDHSWSLSFSQDVIARAYEMVLQNTATPMVGKVIAQFVHKDARADLLRYHEKARDTNTYDVWNRHIFQPVYTTIDVRNLIDAHKK